MSKENNLPFVLTNEDKVSVKGREIEEMAKICHFYDDGICRLCADPPEMCNYQCDLAILVNNLYNAGYRKQSEGEWEIVVTPVEATFICSNCNYFYTEADPQAKTEYRYCPNCGAKMKGGE